MVADKRDILVRLLGEETVSKMAGRAEKGLDRFGDSLEATERDAHDLDRQIGEVEDSLRQLAVVFARTSDAADRVDITKAIRKQQTELRKLTKSRDLLPDFNHTEALKFGGRLAEAVASGLSRAGGAVSAALSNVFGTLPPQAQAAIGAGVVAAVTAAGPAIGAVLGGAVVGAAGVGGIVGGVAIAAKHPEVQAAAKQTGDAFTQELQRAAVSFVPATVESLGIVRSDVHEIGDDLERAFSASSRMLPGLTRRVMAGAKGAVEGFADAVERSGPVVNALGTIAERAGDTVGDVFSDLSQHAVEGAHALTVLWGVFEVGIRATAATVEGLMAAYGVMEKFGAVLTGDVATLGRLAAEQEAAKKSGGGLSQGLQDLIDGFRGAGDSAAAATVKVESFSDMVKRLAGENLTAEQANLRLEEAIDRATEAGRRNNDGIDANTEKGRENRRLLLGIAEAANASADAILEQTGSQELAAEATERGRQKFVDAAIAMGVEKTEAIKLAEKLFAIPNIHRTVTVTANTQPAIDSAKGVVARINNMKARIRVSAEPSGGFGGSAHTGFGYSTGYSAGGYVDGPGTKGVDSKPAMLAPGEGVLTADEVDAVGGPAGFERLRAAIRSGGSPAAVAAGAPAGGMSGQVGIAVQVLADAFAGDDIMAAIVRSLRIRIKNNGGNVQSYLGRES